MKKDFDDLMDVVGGSRRRVYMGFVMDHSGSMAVEAETARKGFNEQIEKVREESKEIDTFVTVLEFGGTGGSFGRDQRIEVPYRNVPVSEINYQDSYWISGGTPLYDSIMNVIMMMKEDSQKFGGDKSFLLYVQTDGAENTSVEFSGEAGRQKVTGMIKELEDTGLWTIVFLGQGIDKAYAEDMGFGLLNTVSFKNRDYGNRVVNNSVATYYAARGMGETQVSNLMDTSINMTESEGYKDEE
jgi:hypothetical protein